MMHWREVPMTLLDGTTTLTATDPRRVRLLAAYRKDGCCGAWLADPDDLEGLSDDEAAEAGPSPDQIDWTGFPEQG